MHAVTWPAEISRRNFYAIMVTGYSYFRIRGAASEFFEHISNWKQLHERMLNYMANTSLHAAKDAKNDEFYTRLEDINEEMNHYEDKFRGKVVFCNCDDPKWSNFWKYFHLNFEYLGLKKLITTHYEPDDVQSYKIEYTGGNDEDFEDGVITPLTQNGDFRSPECLALLDEADIVVTNPPFSLFRDYVAVLIERNKEFLIVGNINAITYKEVFPLIRDNKIWLGCRSLSRDMYFDVPDERKKWLVKNKKEGSAYKIIDGVVMGRASACWYTNLDYPARHINLETSYLYAKKDTLYPDLYPKYDNYDAINVDKTKEIPMDYEGVMGVPITFMDKYNPDQFEIVAFRKGDDGKDLVFTRERERVQPYFRILVRRRFQG